MPYEIGRSAFGNIVNAAPYTLLDSIPLYGLDPAIFDTDANASGVVADDLDKSATVVACGDGTSGAYAKIRSCEHFRYQAGKGQRVIQSLWMNEAVPVGQVRRWGLFDDDDGVFFEARSDGNLYAVVRTSTSGSPVDTAYPLDLPANDNLLRGNIYEIQFQWLGVGEVVFAVNGTARASIDHSGTLAVPYMKTANLQVSVEVVNTAASATGGVYVICNHVRSEGGQIPPMSIFARQRPTFLSGFVGTTPLPLLSIRMAANYKGQANRSVVLPIHANFTSGGGRIFVFAALGSTLTGANWLAVDSNSAVEYDESATAITPGLIVDSVAIVDTRGFAEMDLSRVFGVGRRSLPIRPFAGTSEILSLYAVRDSSNPEATASVQWGEIR